MNYPGIILFLVLISQNLAGQDYAFRVLAARGDNFLNSIDASSKLYAGSILTSHDELVTTVGSYVGLVHDSGHTLELTKPGKYSIAELYEEVKLKENLAKWHLNALWDKVFESLIAAKKSRTGNLGLVVQPIGVNSGKLQAVSLSPQRLNPVYNIKTEIVWIGGSKSTSSRYVVNVMDLYDHVLISETVSQSKFTLDFSDDQLDGGNLISGKEIISFSVHSADNGGISSWRYGLTRLTGKTAEKVKTEVQFFEDAVYPSTLLDQLVFATYYEEKGLLQDALTTYEGLIQKAPDVKDFTLLYNAFIRRNLEKNKGRGL